MPAVGDTYTIRDGEAITIRELTPELLEVEAVWAPQEGRPPRHLHPSQDEHFEVLDGELTFDVARRGAVVVAAGGTIEVAAGTVHRVWNSGSATARARWQIRPAQRTAEMFAALHGGLNPVKAAKVLWTFRHEFRLSSSLRG